MYGEQAMRLLKTKWRSATALAEEIYAIFQDQIPLSTDAPVTINNSTAAPALQVNQPKVPADNFSFPNGTPPAFQLTLGGVPGWSLGTGADGGLVVNGPSFNYQPPAGGAPVNLAGGGSGSGGGLPGFVLSGPTDASGTMYQVKVYPNGLSLAGQVVPVKQLSIDPSSVLPVNTPVIVVGAAPNYYMQSPVWGPPA